MTHSRPTASAATKPRARRSSAASASGGALRVRAAGSGDRSDEEKRTKKHAPMLAVRSASENERPHGSLRVPRSTAWCDRWPGGNRYPDRVRWAGQQSPAISCRAAQLHSAERGTLRALSRGHAGRPAQDDPPSTTASRPACRRIELAVGGALRDVDRARYIICSVRVAGVRRLTVWRRGSRQ